MGKWGKRHFPNIFKSFDDESHDRYVRVGNLFICTQNVIPPNFKKY